MSRRIEWSAAALDDLDQAIAYIAKQDAAAARSIAAGIGNAVSGLAHRPIGRPGRIPGLYEKSVTGLPYIVAYALPDETRLVVVRVIHSARDWPAGGWPRG